MLYYGKKLVIFMISVGLLSLVTFYVSRLAPGDPLFSFSGTCCSASSGFTPTISNRSLIVIHLLHFRLPADTHSRIDPLIKNLCSHITGNDYDP